MHVADQITKVLRDRAEVGRPSKRKWRGSLLGGCVRAHWYSANGVPPSEPFTDDTLKVFAMGNAVGDFLVSALTEAYGDRIKFEVPVESEEENFSGNIDALLEVDGGIAVLEFKSIKHGGFVRLNGAKPEHATQVASYARIIQEDYNRVGLEAMVIEAWVIYVDKDNYSILEYEVDVERWGTRAKRVLNVLNSYGDRVPPRLPGADKRKWPCGWCNWRTKCLGGAK
jgi:hypothetical protein